jgi:epoxyqueuosine reductase
VGVPFAPLVPYSSLPSPSPPRVSALAHVHRVRRRERRAAAGGCDPICGMAPKAPGAMTPEGRSASIKRRALGLGFDAVGVTDLSPPPHQENLRRWLAAGMAGTMSYMHRQAERRCEPSSILAGAIRAVVVTRNYFRPDPADSSRGGLVAKYARGPDYHVALKQPLEQLVSHILTLGPEGTAARAYVDAGPVPERELAQRAGIGWIGKNTMLIDPRRGSFMFLGVILTSLELATDLPFEADRCGSCRRCLDACPTAAFSEERVLDSRRCISYLTIEYRGEIPPDLASQMGNRVFGCDVCQDVCPWNERFARESLDRDPSREIPALLDLTELSRIGDHEFTERYSATALDRPGPEGMRRNAGIALGNARGTPKCQAP